MPPSRFRDKEIEFLSQRIPSWNQLKGVHGRSKRSKAERRKRIDFISLTCKEFYCNFPERDPTVADPNPLTFPKDVVDDFEEIIRQWYRNNTQTEVQSTLTATLQQPRKTSARNLVMKRFGQAIGEIARGLREEDSQLGRMVAFNQATTQFIANLKTDDPEAYEKLSNDAAEMRQASDKDFTELSQETLAQLLEEFPNKFNDELERHSKALPLHIWAVTSFAVPPSQELKTYTMCTPGLRSIVSSSQHSIMVNNYKSWIKDTLGSSAARQSETAEPMVYPDLNRGFKPALPVLVNLEGLPTVQLRSLLRTFFNYTARWQGHRTGVPWTVVANDRNFLYIHQACFPPGVTHLKKVSDMKRDKLLAWYKWILDGQAQRLRPEQVFQFAKLTHGQDNMEFGKIRRCLRARAEAEEEELSNRDSMSGEEIELPESDSDTDSISFGFRSGEPPGQKLSE